MGNQNELRRGEVSRHDKVIRLKKQEQKYGSHIFKFVPLVLSLFYLSWAYFDSSPKTELAPPKKEEARVSGIIESASLKKEEAKVFEVNSKTIKESYDDDSVSELEKFAKMQASFLALAKEHVENKESVSKISEKAEKKFGKILKKAQKKHGGNYPQFKNCLITVAYLESGFNPNAVSKKGAKGLMQIMPGNFHFLKIKNPFDPTQNIMGGAMYLRQLLDKHQGDHYLALAEYNAGPRVIEQNMFSHETKNFVFRAETILKYMNS